MACAWIATSRTMIATTIATTDVCPRPVMTKAIRMSAQAAPIIGRPRPLSLRRPLVVRGGPREPREAEQADDGHRV